MFGYGGGDATIQVGVGHQLVVQAKTNPSTGYNWHLVGSLPSCMQLVSTEYVSTAPEGSQIVGAPSLLELKFVASGPCSGLIQYVYKRGWEDTTGKESTMTIHVSVTPSSEL